MRCLCCPRGLQRPLLGPIYGIGAIPLPTFAMWFTIEILYIAGHRELARLSWALGCPQCQGDRNLWFYWLLLGSPRYPNAHVVSSIPRG